MRAKFRPLAGQVVVVTDAASGLGLEAAKLAAKAGAAVVLAAADEAAVRAACEAIAKAGGRVHPVAADTRLAEGCDRVARAAAARFGRIDSWIDAARDDLANANAVRALAAQLGDGEHRAALVAFSRRIGKAARAELRRAKGKVAATFIRLPDDWSMDTPTQAARAALHAVTKPMGQMALAPKDRGLTVATHVRKHPGVLAGVGLLAVAGVALWFGRGRLAQAAAVARPKVARAVRPAFIGLAKRRPLQAARLAAKHPKQGLKLAKALR
jgi:NAD(P)-dependent dehydrogenase (short-subunit alcohol dehydrogenase family)